MPTPSTLGSGCRQRVLVIGAGVAGLSVAWALAKRGYRSVRVLERERLPFSHSSARNAAIFRPAEAHPMRVELALRTRQLLIELDPSGLLRPSALLLVAEREGSLDQLAQTARGTGLRYEALSGAPLARAAPTLTGGLARYGLRFADSGVLDIHGIGQRLQAAVRSLGVELCTGVEVRALEVEHEQVKGVVTNDSRLQADAVVLAAGAWCLPLVVGCTNPLPLRPHRRHLAYLRPRVSPQRRDPAIWDVETGVYYRPESQGYLATPADQHPHAPRAPLLDPAQAEQLAQKLPRLSPQLGEAQLQRMWACLRTLSLDDQMILGSDPLLRNLYWFAGLGGHGMSCGLAAGELLARAIATGQEDELRSLRATRWASLSPHPSARRAVLGKQPSQ